MARVPLFLLAIYLARGLPAIVYLRLLGRSRSVIAGVLQATSLTVIVAATQIGLQLGVVSQASSAELIARRASLGGDLPGPHLSSLFSATYSQKVVQSPRPYAHHHTRGHPDSSTGIAFVGRRRASRTIASARGWLVNPPGRMWRSDVCAARLRIVACGCARTGADGYVIGMATNTTSLITTTS